MIKKEAPHPVGGTAGQGKHKDYCNDDFITSTTNTQGRIFPLLLAGEENAVPSEMLAQLAGYKNQRSMRVAVDHERELGLPVLASEVGYFRPASGDQGISEVRRFLRRQDARAASIVRDFGLVRKKERKSGAGEGKTANRWFKEKLQKNIHKGRQIM